MCTCDLTPDYLARRGAIFSAKMHRLASLGVKASHADNKRHFQEEHDVLCRDLRRAGFVADADRIDREHAIMIATMDRGEDIDPVYFGKHATFEDECVKKLLAMPQVVKVPKVVKR